MSTGLIMPLPAVQITDAAGAAVSGALYYTWLSGTTTPVSVWTDSALTVAHPWPAVADSAGRLVVYGDRSVGYKVEARTPAGVVLWSQDNVLLPPDVAPPVANSVPTGSGMDYWGTVAPTGYIFAAGQAISRTTYAALFAIFGTMYNTGGEAGTDFRVPDKRQRYSIGKADSGTGDTLGETFGAIDHTHSIPEETVISANNSTLSLSTSTALAESGVTDPITVVISAALSGTHTHDVTVYAGDGTSGTNNPPTIVCNYIIKT